MYYQEEDLTYDKHPQGEVTMKDTKNLEPKTLEQRAAEVADDASSETFAAFIVEFEDALSETTKRVETERVIFDTSIDTATAQRTITQNEIARSRLRVKLAEFQQKFAAQSIVGDPPQTTDGQPANGR
jgi:hypothetical protein